ncbi:MAG: SPOR domain-containing protein [Treponema sp.]|nr:SPOR domain-containing protein [Treponema sp.]
MKKILIFCLYCMIFTLIPAVSVFAGGGKDEQKPFPTLDNPDIPEMPSFEGKSFPSREITPAYEQEFLVPSGRAEASEVEPEDEPFPFPFDFPEMSAGNQAVPPPPAPERPAGREVEQFSFSEMSAGNEPVPPSAPERPAVREVEQFSFSEMSAGNQAVPPPPAPERPAGREVEQFSFSEMSAANQAVPPPPAPERPAVREVEQFSFSEMSAANQAESSPVPEMSAGTSAGNGREHERVDEHSQGATAAVVSAAESAAAAAQSAAAAAQSARAAETAAAAAAASSQLASQPSASSHSHLPPQPPVRTVAPTVNIILPSAAAPPAAPPAYRYSINVIPGMPDPYRGGVYRVQLGAFSNTGLAQQCFNRLKSTGFTPYYEQFGSLYRVVIIGIRAADMDGVIRRLEAAGFSDAWIREER